jgi:hypothetical protein
MPTDNVWTYDSNKITTVGQKIWLSAVIQRLKFLTAEEQSHDIIQAYM